MSDTYPQFSNTTPSDDKTSNDALSDGVSTPKEELEAAVDAPLVDMALQQVAEHDNSISAAVGQDIAVLRAEVESVSQRAVEMQDRMISSAKAGAETTARSARDTVRQFPLVSLGLAVAVGFLAGLRSSR